MSILNSFVEYNRIYWKNKKAGGTPTGATNFNIMDKGIKANNDAIKELNEVKADKSEIPDISGLATKEELVEKADKSEIPTTVAQLTDSTDYAKKTDLPNNTNQLTNGAGFITKSNGVSIHTDVSSNILTNFRTELGFENGNPPVSTLRTNENIDGMCQYSPGIAFETGDTHGYLNVNFDTPKAYIGGGNGQGIIWYDEVVLKNHIGADWLPSNGISIDDLPNGAYSTNPEILPGIGIPSGLSEFGTLIVNKTPSYDSIIFHDIFGRFAVYNTHEGKWTIFVSTENLATTTKDGLMSAADKIKLDSFEAAGMQIDIIKCLENTKTLEVSDEEMSGYDFVYFMIGSEYYGSQSTGDTVPWDVMGEYSTLIPVDWLSRMLGEDCVVRTASYNGTTNSVFYIERNTNNDGLVASGPFADQTIIAWGIKSGGASVSDGGKVLAIETDTTASTYHISGNADTTPLMLETVAYGSDGSVKDISSGIAYVDGSGAVKLKTMATAISNTYGVVTTSSLGVISVSNKEGYKLKVWITGSGYTVTKQ